MSKKLRLTNGSPTVMLDLVGGWVGAWMTNVSSKPSKYLKTLISILCAGKRIPILNKDFVYSAHRLIYTCFNQILRP
jgi:hypothetical protein